MATTIGSEKDLVRRLNHLIELDFDTVEAYEAAIDRLGSEQDRGPLRRFMADHQRHTRELSELVMRLGGRPAMHADLKRVLTRGKVILAGLVDEGAVLFAMASNENDTNRAYARALEQPDLPAFVRDVLERNLADERRHRAWIDERLGRRAARDAARP